MKEEEKQDLGLPGAGSAKTRQGQNFRPIPFKAPMVCAILEDRKTQTRRVIKLKFPFEAGIAEVAGYHMGTTAVPPVDMRVTLRPAVYHHMDFATFAEKYCPYGQPGDRLYVKEALKRCGEWAFYDLDGTAVQIGNHDQKWRWKNAKLPARFMPKDYSRITLEITGVRVERLNSISEADAKAEGVEAQRVGYWADGRAGGKKVGGYDSYIESFGELWDSINGKARRVYYEDDDGKRRWRIVPPMPWASNPWVWVISFCRVQMEKVLTPPGNPK